MSLPSRVLFRRSHFALNRSLVRNASSTSQATEAASQTASKAQATMSSVTSKASQGLSRVTSSAGPALSGAAQGAGKALRGIGGRTGRLISLVESMVPPTIYYSKVGLELSKLVFQQQKMSPPSLSTMQSYLQPVLHAARNPMNTFTQTTTTSNALTPQHLLSQIRSTSPQQLASAGIVAAEVIGFFTVGEMIGRFKIVGYHGDKPEHY